MFTKDDTVHHLKQDNASASAIELANNAGRKVREVMYSAGDELAHAQDTVTTEIRTNPVRSSLIALGVGFVLGSLLRR
jgi:hypothetical protein